MAEPLNQKSPATFNTAILIADPVATTNGSVDSVAKLTTVANVPVSAAFEVQSTTGAMLAPRMTTAQRNALSSSTGAVTNGMFIYNLDTNTFQFYQNSTWVTFTVA